MLSCYGASGTMGCAVTRNILSAQIVAVHVGLIWSQGAGRNTVAEQRVIDQQVRKVILQFMV